MLMRTVFEPTTPLMTFFAAHGSAGGATKATVKLVAGASTASSDHAPMPMIMVAPASLKNCSSDGPPITPQPSSSIAVTAAPLLHWVARSSQLSKSALAQLDTVYTPACGAVNDV